MGVSKALKKQARRPEQACPRDDRHRACSIKFEVYGEFTGRVFDREGLGIPSADLGHALGDRAREHAGGGNRHGPEDTDGEPVYQSNKDVY